MGMLATINLKLDETAKIFWVLVKITVPITIAAMILLRWGVIAAIAPFFAPVMEAVGLPAELGLAWLTGLIVGPWGAVPLIFALVPVSSLSVAQVTILSSLLLFMHALPIEQKIIKEAGPNMIATTVLRIGGGLLYAFILHRICQATGWLSAPVDPTWIPVSGMPSWTEFLSDLTEATVWMYLILLFLSLGLEALKALGILDLIMKAMSPMLRLIGIEGNAVYLTAIGLLLGISFGAGLLIREAQSGTIPPRQIFLSCIFMGFAHSMIEDTLLMMALGADAGGIVVGRLIFAFIATGVIAYVLRHISETTFLKFGFSPKGSTSN
jgi:spore maturation protein SpmB